MTQTFSLPSSSLGYYIGWSLLQSDTVALVSPWISDVDITFPVTNSVDQRQLSLIEALKQLGDATEVLVYIRSGEEHNNYITDQLSESVAVRSVDDLHAKAVVSPEHAYVGSANITRGGLSVHREICQIVENEYEGVEGYLSAELGL